MLKFIDNYFQVTNSGSSFKKEFVGAFTSYLAMVYVIFVNPIVLSSAGMNPDAVFTATIFATAIATMVMGVYAKYPLGIAPCMSMNAFFAFSVVLGTGMSWQQALACVLLSSILFMLISFFNVRTFVIAGLPSEIKQAATVGLGIFIAFVGLKNSSIIVSDPSMFIKFGSFSDPNVIIAMTGILVSCIFLVRKNNYAVFIGIISSVAMGLFIGALNTAGVITLADEVAATLPVLPEVWFELPTKAISAMVNETLFVSVMTVDEVLNISGLVVIMTFLFLDFFGTATTLTAAQSQVESFTDEDAASNKKVFMADAIGSFAGSLLGTSNLSTYIESVSGVLVGARTGLMSVFLSLMFLASLFLFPFLSLFTAATTTSALVVIGIFMMKNIVHVDWQGEYEIVIPSFVTIVMMPLTGSIALGLTMGFVLYELLMFVSGRGKELNKTMHFVTIISLLYMSSL